MPAFSPARPWRAETRLVPSKATASEGPGAYLFSPTHPKLPRQLVLRVGYVEDLNDARTTLAGFFNTRYSKTMLEPGDFILKI